MTDEKKDKSSLPASFGIMEKVWEWQWIIRFIYIVLFADLSLLVYSGSDVLTWPTQVTNWTAHLGFFCVALATLGMIATTVMPCIANFIRSLLNEFIYSNLCPDFLRPCDNYREIYGEVTSREVLDLALEENNQFLLNYYEKYYSKWKSNLNERFKVGDLLFGILFFIILDYHPTWISNAQHSLITDLFYNFGEHGAVTFYIMVLIIFMALMNIWFGKWDWGHIYYPPLYRKKEEFRRKQREEEGQWRR